MKKLILIVALLQFAHANIFAQTRQIADSLKNKLEKTSTDTGRVLLLANLSGVYRLFNPDSSLLYAQKAYALANSVHYLSGEAMALGNQSMALAHLGNLPAALRQGLKALSIADYNHLIAEKSLVLSALDQIYNTLNDYNTALNYARQMYSIALPEGGIGLGYAGLDMALTFFNLGQMDSARYYTKKSMETFNAIGFRIEPLDFLLLGDIELKLGNGQKALANYHDGLLASLKNIEPRATSKACISIARLYQNINKVDSGIFYAQKGLVVAEQLSQKQMLLEAATLLSQLYEPTNAKEALRYHKIASAINDSLYGSANVQAIQTVAKQYEESKREVEEAKATYQTRLKLYAFFTVAGVLLVITVIVYRNNLQKKKANVVLAHTLANLTAAKNDLENKHQELQIEAALENIRTSAMAMQKSGELGDVAGVLFDKLRQFGGSPYVCGVALCQKNNPVDEFWLSTAPGIQPHFFIPNTDDPTQKRMYQGWMNGDEYYTEEMDGEALRAHHNYLRSLPNMQPVMNSIETHGAPPPVWQKWHAAYFNSGYLLVITTKPFTEHTLLKRFAKVFEQCYTRFLDLQKAEAQAREAQVEASLERVRAKTMGMQKSPELRDVTVVLYEQLKQLGFTNGAASIIIMDSEKGDMVWWMEGSHDGYNFLESYHVPNFEHPAHIELLTNWKNGVPFAITKISGECKKKFDEYYFNYTDFARTPEDTKQFMRQKDTVNFSVAYMLYGGLAWTETDVSDDQPKILQRFAKVFEQTYTRFIDLKKAELAAREANIENALEKIRSRSLAMHRSDELKDVMAVMFQRLTELDVLMGTVAIQLFDPVTKECTFWVGNDKQQPAMVKLPYDENMMLEDNYMKDCWQARNSGESFFNKVYSFEQNYSYFQYVFAHNDTDTVPPAVREFILKAPSHLYCLIIEKNSALVADNYDNKYYTEYQIDVLKRSAKVFDQAFVRFLDLQKAETQAKEAQIEAALERVRAKTMGMQKSTELRDVAITLYEQLKHLGFTNGAASIIIIDSASGDMECWVEGSRDGYNFLESYRVPNFDHPAHIELLTNFKNGVPFAITKIYGELKKSYDDYYFTKTDFIRTPDDTKQFMRQRDTVFLSVAYMLYGGLSWVQSAVSDEQATILQRFAKVFEQTYTRFLDLQNAEAQARESQIQLALERVRARTMAMHNSAELMDVAVLLFDQLKFFGADSLGVAFAICAHDDVLVTKWTNIGILSIPYNAEAGEQRMYEAWKKQEEFCEEIYDGERIKKYYELFFTFPEFAQGFQKVLDDGYPMPNWQANYAAIFKYGYLLIITTKPFNEKQLCVRFAKVFEQTYTRFIDLKKAELAAREANIENALEKIRSRSLAMHRSDELKDVMAVMFQRLTELDVLMGTVGIQLFDPVTKDCTFWVGTDRQHPVMVKLPYDESMLSEDNYMRDYWQARNSGESFFNKVYSIEQKYNHYQYVFAHNDINTIPIPVREFILKADHSLYCLIIEKNSALVTDNFYNQFYTEHQIDVLKRTAKVFDQAFVRFLDLQKVEAQARESQIQLALERVRARTMAMQKSDELAEVAGLLFKQVADLGIVTWTTGFNVWSEDGNTFTDYITSPQGGFIKPYMVHTNSTSILQELAAARKRGDDFFVQFSEGEELKQTYLALAKFGDEKQYDVMLQDGFEFPLQQYNHFVFGANISLMFITYGPVPEAHEIFKRVGKVFQQTYTRFLDLQKAEHQAREAVKRASVDRVRAEIASMRTAGHLQRITPLIWEELTNLGVPFIRCGVFIVDEQNEQIHAYLSTPDGKANAAFQLSFNTGGIGETVLQNWRHKQQAAIYMTKEDLKMSTDALVQQGAVEHGQQYFNELPSTNLNLHFCPFLQGMLYVGNSAPLTGDQNGLVQSLADAFSTAYARYEDFNKLELAKQQVEKTLTELKSTQTQLIQKEKMASLGELTAGIAHEIQNPLNFVNNFSEVSRELIAEMRDEMEAGNKVHAGQRNYLHLCRT